MALPKDDEEGDPDSEMPWDDTFWGRSAHHGRPPVDWVPCFRLRPGSALYAPGNVTDGYARPFGAGHSWLSDPVGAGDSDDAWIELAWEEPRTVGTVQLAFNTKLNRWYNIFGREDRAEPETVRDYRIEVRTDDGYEPVHRETGNYQRFRRHVSDPVETDRLRVVVEATNGVPWAEVFEIRAYGPETTPPVAPCDSPRNGRADRRSPLLPGGDTRWPPWLRCATAFGRSTGDSTTRERIECSRPYASDGGEMSGHLA